MEIGSGKGSLAASPCSGLLLPFFFLCLTPPRTPRRAFFLAAGFGELANSLSSGADEFSANRTPSRGLLWPWSSSEEPEQLPGGVTGDFEKLGGSEIVGRASGYDKLEGSEIAGSAGD